MSIPEGVITAWRELAEGNAVRQRERHDSGGHNQPYESCWYCTKNRAICKSKRRHETIEDAQRHCDETNTPNGQLLTPYRCFWSEGLHWHAGTAKTSAKRRRARKRMARIFGGVA